LLGGKARYFRRYDGFGLDTLSDKALFIGPTAYFQLSDRSRLTASWSTHAWGRASGMPADSTSGSSSVIRPGWFSASISSEAG